MNVLALNCGSSSIKFRIFTLDGGAEPRRVAQGGIERIGEAATIEFTAEGGAAVQATERVPDHAAGVRRVLDWTSALGRIDAVGHRVVHGGSRFTAFVAEAAPGRVAVPAGRAPGLEPGAAVVAELRGRRVGVLALRARHQAAEKGPSASLAPSAARSTYRQYASRAAFGRRLAAGPF